MGVLDVQPFRPSNTNPVYSKGAFTTVSDDIATSSGSTSTTLAAFDCIDSKSISIQMVVLSTWTGTLSFETSNDGINWSPKQVVSTLSGNIVNAFNGVAVPTGPYSIVQADIGARYIRVRQSAYTSGQIRTISVLSAFSTSIISQQGFALNNSTNNIGYVGSVSSVESGTLAALNATVGGTNDLANMGQVQVQVTGTWVGTILFQASLDGTNWTTKMLIESAGLNKASQIATNGIYFGHVGARYFRALMNGFTSGSAALLLRYNAASGEMPMPTVGLSSRASGDGFSSGSVDEVALAAFNGGSIDRLATAAGSAALNSSTRALHVASGSPVILSINALTAPASGSANDNQLVRSTHILQVDITTSVAGTAGTHTVQLQGSLDGTNYFTIASVTPSSSSTSASDASNHAYVSAATSPWRFVRAAWTAVPASWAGTLTARVASS